MVNYKEHVAERNLRLRLRRQGKNGLYWLFVSLSLLSSATVIGGMIWVMILIETYIQRAS